jgi:hypothetical protein
MFAEGGGDAGSSNKLIVISKASFPPVFFLELVGAYQPIFGRNYTSFIDEIGIYTNFFISLKISILYD